MAAIGAEPLPRGAFRGMVVSEQGGEWMSQDPSTPGAAPRAAPSAPIPLDDAALTMVAGGLLDPSQLSSMTPQQILQLLQGSTQGG